MSDGTAPIEGLYGMARPMDTQEIRGSSKADARVVLDAIAIAVVVTNGIGIVTCWNGASE